MSLYLTDLTLYLADLTLYRTDLKLYLTDLDLGIFWQMKVKIGSAGVWTHDLVICSLELYHWAIEADMG